MIEVVITVLALIVGALLGRSHERVTSSRRGPGDPVKLMEPFLLTTGRAQDSIACVVTEITYDLPNGIRFSGTDWKTHRKRVTYRP